MSTGRSPPASADAALSLPDQKKPKIEQGSPMSDSKQDIPAQVGGIDTALLRKLPRAALLDVLYQALPTSTALQAIVLEKLQTATLLAADTVEVEDTLEEIDGTRGDEWEDAESGDDNDMTEPEDLSGEEEEEEDESHLDERLRGLSPLAKLIMEIMNSAPAPEGGMPWREFEGIWPPVMGTVAEAIKECRDRGVLVTADTDDDFVVSTMPMADQAAV
ncbi:hypothetical protein BCR37DRAFT_380833 [Protomyces lactucae-debilis]|uniref:Uncharacterized protein n=1 Tax=Protomyces lactucae-debilis TaxID=2754530 RepID=A0A1Y2FAP9_PROLT|nr:uncharacterized protein BCR37DRAFT_380833 [Protomyces lactucae-debilis]ORY80953.1 hypothetical protein BCR37DRAFT_380833 [Protomyces lactucae-debilis]